MKSIDWRCPECGKPYEHIVEWFNGSKTYVHKLGDSCHVSTMQDKTLALGFRRRGPGRDSKGRWIQPGNVV